MTLQPLYTFYGQIIHGFGNGHTVHMPTANLSLPAGAALPPLGVYASLVHLLGQTYIGVTYVGLRPTISDSDQASLETYIVGFDGDAYGQDIALELYHFLRPTRKMSSLDEVHQQVEKDAPQACALLRDLIR